MDPGPVRDVLTAILGLATGVLSGLFGVGGGVISQPGMRLLGIEPLVAIGTALPAILPSAVSGTLRYTRERLIDWRAVSITVPAGLAAAFAGGLLAESVPGDGHLLQVVTACLLGFSAWRMSRPPAAVAIDPDTGDPEVQAAVSAGAYVAIGAVAGLLSGLLGIGGGVLMVPAFAHVARMGVKQAIATSLVCVGAFAVPGTIAHAIADHISWRVALLLVLGVVPGARIGAHLAIKSADRRLRMAVSAFLGLTAVVYGGSELAILLT